ncbi:hypothetical protein [Methylosinus sp. LW4]|uniref:hypothetical protein n=1 Tax=Methylosinus sp. LW4 TaxID=136993 RepID=UPI00036609A7|nr:hypothetical protein [Methylosinus sp. LW4]
MAPDDVVAFFRGAIESYWTFTLVKWPNEQPFDPNSQPYLELQFPLYREQLASMGAPGADYLAGEGAAHIALLTPIGGGLQGASSEQWQTRFNTLIASLRPKVFANGLGQTFEAQTSASYEDDGYFVRSTAIAYAYQKFG